MSFEDLPRDVRHLPLNDPVLAADVIDLIVRDVDRSRGCLAVMVCDEEHRGIQPVVVMEVPEDAGPATLDDVLGLLLPMVAQRGGSVVIGRGRAHDTRPSDDDRACHQRAIECCREQGVPLLGFHLATLDAVVRLPDPLRAASDRGGSSHRRSRSRAGPASGSDLRGACLVTRPRLSDGQLRDARPRGCARGRGRMATHCRRFCSIVSGRT